MKRSFSLFLSVVGLAGFLLTACSGSAPTLAQQKPGVESARVQFVGTIETMQGNQWTINGQAVEVSPDLVDGMTFQVGDDVKVAAVIDKNGEAQAESIEKPDDDSGTNSNDDSKDDTSSDDDGNSDDDSKDDTSSDDDGNSNDDSKDDTSNDDDGNSNDDSKDDTSNDDTSNDDDGND